MDRAIRPPNITPGTYRFDEFFAIRMYGKDGYYNNGNGVGVDFNTHVSLNDTLGTRIGQWLDEKWLLQNRPNPFQVYELGAGDGTLCRQILSSKLQCSSALEYIAVEQNTNYHNKFPDGAKVIASLPNTQITGVIMGNEVLDVQPMRFVSFRNNIWQELFICVADKPRYEWRPICESLPKSLLAIRGLNGSAPLIQKSADLLRHSTERFTGDLLMIDYGYLQTKEFPGKQWFRSYHQYRPAPVLDITIQSDLSCCVPIDQLGELFAPPKITTQSEWLQSADETHTGFYVLEWQIEEGKPK